MRPFAGLFIAIVLGACNEARCDAAEVQARLDAASPGETVTIGACVLFGTLNVGRGVRLRGAGADATRVVGPADGRAIVLAADASETAILDLRVESDGCAAIVARGEGRIAIRAVAVQVARGVGVAAEGVTELALNDVTVEGPVSAATADSTIPPLPPFRCGSGEVATHGVVLVGVGMAEMIEVRADGFGAFGVLAVRSRTRWSGGGASNNLGAGVEIWGGEATLEDLRLTDNRDGAGVIESYGAVFGGGATITTSGLVVEGGDSFGLFHEGVTAIHDGLVVRDQGFAALWAQGSSSLELRGSSMLEGNAFAGVVGLGSSNVVVRDATIARTEEALRISGVRTVRAGDGVHLVDSDAILERVVLLDNARIGALVDLATTSTTRIALADVTVEASGMALGAVAQNGAVAAGWDRGITRRGDTAINDAAFAGTLEIAGAVGPVCFPPLDELDTAGLGPLVGF